jgi:DNA (cytosine-5)-methyltransferase 1
VCLDLENEGYEVQPFIIPAAAKNAPHRRDRCWFIGVRNATDNHGIIRREGGKSEPRKQSRHGESNEGCDTQINGIATNTNGNGLNQCNGNDEINASERRINAQRDIKQGDVYGNATDTLHKGLQRGPEINGREKYNAERRGNGVNIGADGKNISGKIRREFQEFPTQSPICSGDDGLPTKLDGITFSKWRAESIKGYGNAIVPQIAYQLFQIIETL